MEVPPGDYRFIMMGNAQSNDTYHVNIACVSDEPTPSPTQVPTIKRPTPKPIPTTNPTGTDNPTSSPSNAPSSPTSIDDAWTDNVGLVVLVVIAVATALFVVIYVLSRCHLKRKRQQGNNNSIKTIQKSGHMELEDVRKDQKKILDKEKKDDNEQKAEDDNEANEPGKEDSFDGMFVAKVGEDSVSNSNQNETLQH
eukprot:964114_1